MKFDPDVIRSEFPALAANAVFFDNPGGTQVHQNVVERMQDYLIHSNANHGGAFATSRRSDEIIERARDYMASMLNAADPAEVFFGPNMTSLTFSVSRALALELQPGDEIIVTRLDHDANISPWLRVAEDRDCRIRWLDFDVEDCTLRLDSLQELLSNRTRLIAVGYASNAVGTINPVREIASQAHQAGALCFVDAVQYAPHGPIDVQALDCDFLVVSAYKFFGPHVGAMYGKLQHLERLAAYKVRPAPSRPPGKFETGTQNHEGLAGVLGAVEYLASLGERFGGTPAREEKAGGELTADIAAGMRVVQAYEAGLSTALIEGLASIPGLHIWGLTDSDRVMDRVPTVSFTLDGYHPRQIAEFLGDRGIYVWDGNYYALAVTERLGLEDSGGMLRVGLTHYNTQAEISQLIRSLEDLVTLDDV
ncbi:MAG: cysteine desulfurase-like protein [Anaerolineales bacterium]